jgi:cyclopropane fatty-acyl-phospholipid synthase-like methyltransferase
MNNTEELFSLGDLYVSDFLNAEEKSSKRQKYELKLLLEKDTGAVKLEKTPPANTMWGKYWYRSGTNQTMKDHLNDIVQDIKKTIQIEPKDIWLDIACNDGTLLSFVPKETYKIGIDPADNTFLAESTRHADVVSQHYFSKDVYNSVSNNRKTKVVTSIAMFYDVPNPDSFIKDVYDILEDDGMWVLQMSYTPLMLKQMAFDNICHEHLYYYSLFNIKKLLERNGFTVLNCTLNDANGGSFRVMAVKSNSDKTKFSTQQNRDIFAYNIDSLLAYEATLELDKAQTWKNFFKKIQELKEQTVKFICEERLKGKKIYAYGASTKGNTLLQYFGLDNSKIDAIAERSHYKYGLKTIGTEIPIISEEQMRSEKPDYLLVLPWHFIDEFKKREQDFLLQGGKFIVPCPKFEII